MTSTVALDRHIPHPGTCICSILSMMLRMENADFIMRPQIADYDRCRIPSSACTDIIINNKQDKKINHTSVVALFHTKNTVQNIRGEGAKCRLGNG